MSAGHLSDQMEEDSDTDVPYLSGRTTAAPCAELLICAGSAQTLIEALTYMREHPEAIPAAERHNLRDLLLRTVTAAERVSALLARAEDGQH
jgi:hypothetical protein